MEFVKNRPPDAHLGMIAAGAQYSTTPKQVLSTLVPGPASEHHVGRRLDLTLTDSFIVETISIILCAAKPRIALVKFVSFG